MMSTKASTATGNAMNEQLAALDARMAKLSVVLPELLLKRSKLMQEMGRLSEAMSDVKKAVKLLETDSAGESDVNSARLKSLAKETIESIYKHSSTSGDPFNLTSVIEGLRSGSLDKITQSVKMLRMSLSPVFRNSVSALAATDALYAAYNSVISGDFAAASTEKALVDLYQLLVIMASLPPISTASDLKEPIVAYAFDISFIEKLAVSVHESSHVLLAIPGYLLHLKSVYLPSSQTTVNFSESYPIMKLYANYFAADYKSSNSIEAIAKVTSLILTSTAKVSLQRMKGIQEHTSTSKDTGLIINLVRAFSGIKKLSLDGSFAVLLAKIWQSVGGVGLSNPALSKDGEEADSDINNDGKVAVITFVDSVFRVLLDSDKSSDRLASVELLLLCFQVR
jgi:hypothetical protein